MLLHCARLLSKQPGAARHICDNLQGVFLEDTVTAATQAWGLYAEESIYSVHPQGK